jgi:signal transduction histidine kinase
MMTTSLRGRLLLWYTTMAAVVMIVFGTIVCYLAWRAELTDLDAALRSRAGTLAAGVRPAGPDTFDLTLPPDAAEALPASYYVVWTPSGALIDTSNVARGLPEGNAEGFGTADGHREFTRRAAGAYVLVGVPLDTLWSGILNLAATMALVGVAALAVSFVGGWFLVGRALVPVGRINDTARAMVDGDFTARIPVEHLDTELWQLARALNEAFDRLHAALERQRRFTADASHELRTPLALVATESEWALRRDRQLDEYRRSLEVCQRASSRMQGVVERLLALARAESRTQRDAQMPVRLDEITASVVRDLRSLSDARGLSVTLEMVPVTCLGDHDRLVDAVTNVVGNAIHYNVPDGHIRIAVRDSGAHAEIVVSDTGIGISAEHLPHIFEPFFRADAARTRAVGGSGLGLAVTRATVMRHGGDATCTSEPGRGTSVRIRLPRADTGLAPPPEAVAPFTIETSPSSLTH